MYSAWHHILRSCFWLAALENVVFVSSRPVVSNLDDNGRWHSEEEAAVRFADGYSAFIWHGTPAMSRAILEPPTLEAIDTSVNMETRRVLISRFGLQQYILQSGTVVSKDKYGTLYRREERSEENIMMVHVVNKTPEPDGTFKEYFLRVPLDTRPKHGIAWTFGLNEDEYDPQVET